jgi:hypothetical protein
MSSVLTSSNRYVQNLDSLGGELWGNSSGTCGVFGGRFSFPWNRRGIFTVRVEGSGESSDQCLSLLTIELNLSHASGR